MERVLKKVLKGIKLSFMIPAYTLIYHPNNRLVQFNDSINLINGFALVELATCYYHTGSYNSVLNKKLSFSCKTTGFQPKNKRAQAYVHAACCISYW